MKEKQAFISFILLSFVSYEQLNLNTTDTNLNPFILWGKNLTPGKQSDWIKITELVYLEAMSLLPKCPMVFAHLQFNKYLLNLCIQGCVVQWYRAWALTAGFLDTNLRLPLVS